MNPDRQKALKYAFESRFLRKEIKNLRHVLDVQIREKRNACKDASFHKRQAHTLSRKLDESGAMKAIETLHEIQDILKVGRTYTGTLTAVKELVRAMGLEVK